MSEFNIEKAIRSWRKTLRKQQGLEPGMIEELEINLRDRIDEFRIKGFTDEDAFRKAAAKSLGADDGEELADEFYKIRTPFYKLTPPWKGDAKWFSLLPNFLKVALRSFKRKKVYTSINFLGLVIGLLTACFVVLYINNELSWDDFHSKSDRIIRLGSEFRSQEYSLLAYKDYYNTPREEQVNQTEAIKNTIGVEDLARFWIFGGSSYLETGDRRFVQDGILTTNTPSGFFNLFDWKFIHGSVEQFSSSINKAVLTEETARKISSTGPFSLSELIGQSFVLDSTSYEIAGIIQDIPSNSHYDFNVALNDSKIEYWGARTYALLEENADPETVKKRWESKVSEINPRMVESGLFKSYVIHKLGDIHLEANALYELKPPGNPRYLWIFGIIGAVILLITFTNYTNLSVAMYAGRNREIGMRKVLGADRLQIACQFLIESLLLALFCIPAVMMLLSFLLPYFNNFMGIQISNLFLESPLYFLMLISASAFIGLIAGAYPSLVLSGKKIRHLFNKQLSKPTLRGFTLRKGLITFQFVLLIGLGSATYFINSQLNYINNKDIGYAKEGIVYVLMEDGESYRQFRSKLTSLPSIYEVGTGSALARNTYNQTTYRLDGYDEIFDDAYNLWMTPSAVRAYGIETSIEKMLSDSTGIPNEVVLINQTAAEKFSSVLGVEKQDLIGRTYRTEPRYTQEDGTVGFPATIAGFFEDINMFSLKEEVDPYFLSIRKDVVGSWAIVSYNTADVSNVMNQIESAYNELGQSFPFITRFQSDRLANLYEQDQRVGTLTIYLSLLAFLVAVLGLVGLAAYLTTLRRKEIGVRKVLGASSWEILLQLNREYVYLVGISLLIAGPIAYYAVSTWLSNFAYRIDVNLFVFPGIAIFTLFIAILAVSSQTAKATQMDPVSALKNDQ
jgi:putative ABC transport system permease protein